MNQTCLHCRSEFTPAGYRRQKYCSRRCGLAFNQAKRQRKHRKQLNQIKVEKGCARCGYNQHPAALQFNHLDPSTKSFEVGSRILHKWSLLEEEMAKCEVLCANCHAVHSFTENHHALSVRH